MAEGEFDPGDHVPWASVRAVAARRFGIRRFRPGQRELIEAVLAGRDAIGLLPTGAGKSLCFQLPSLFLRGAVVVISPLIALMHDQVEHLDGAGIEAARLDSTVPVSDQAEKEGEIREGLHDVILLTPERLQNAQRLLPLQQRDVALLVVDEAHCISQWGHDFRPAYLELRHAVQALGRPPLLALTATAPPDLIGEIAEKLGMINPVIVQSGIERSNLFLEAHRTVNRQEKEAALIELLRSEAGNGIVYCATVRRVDELHAWLKQQGFDVERYHGRMSKGSRSASQDRFMRGESRVMVATSAFGMGIDKADIRFVVHWHFPGSVESYYQEAGRAGRDGQPARCILFYRLEDKRIRSFFLGGKAPQRADAVKLLRALAELTHQRARVTLRGLAAKCGLSERRVSVLVNALEDIELITRSHRAMQVNGNPRAEQIEDLFGNFDAQHAAERERLQAMIRYCETLHCRMHFLREYFGEPGGEACQHCDNCAQPVASSRSAAIGGTCELEEARIGASSPSFMPGRAVKHRTFGEGEVVRAEEEQIIVSFPRHGEKRILASRLRLLRH